MKMLFSMLPGRLLARGYEVTLFVIVGLLNTAVDFATLNLLIILTHHSSGLWLIAFTCMGFLAAVINSYLLNGRLTFRGQTSHSSSKFMRFFAVNAVGMIINSFIVWFMVLLIGNRLPVLAAINVSKLLAISCSLSWNYFAIKRWVFTGQTTHLAQETSSPLTPILPSSLMLEQDGVENQLHSSLPQSKGK